MLTLHTLPVSTGSCCDLREHHCDPQNRGLNNKCFDDCMCAEGGLRWLPLLAPGSREHFRGEEGAGRGQENPREGERSESSWHLPQPLRPCPWHWRPELPFSPPGTQAGTAPTLWKRDLGTLGLCWSKTKAQTAGYIPTPSPSPSPNTIHQMARIRAWSGGQQVLLLLFYLFI